MAKWQDFVPDIDININTLSWDDITDLIPDKGDIADLIPDGEDLYEFLDELDDLLPDINVNDYIPKDVQKKLGNAAKDIAELLALGYDNLDVKGNYIDPWTDKVLDYADFNVVVPKSGKVMTKGTSKNDLMSGHWEKHKYEGGNGNDRIFTWYGKDTLIGGNGNDHLYVDGDDCTMIGGNGKDYFYLDGGGTALIKDYRKKGKDVIRVDGYSKGDIKVTQNNGNSYVKTKKGNHTLAKIVGSKKVNKNDLQYSGGKNSKSLEVDDHEGHDHDHHDHEHDHHGHAHHRSIEPTAQDALTDLFAAVSDF